MRLTATEYTELLALASKELIGSDREDARAALAGVAMNRAVGGKAELEHLIPPRLEPDVPEQTMGEMEAALLGLIPVKDGDSSNNQHQGSPRLEGD